MTIKKKLANRLVDIITPPESRGENLNALTDMLVGLIPNQNENINELLSLYKEVFSHDRMADIVSDIYAKYLEEDEMIDLINFFSTKSGQKWIQNQSSINREILENSIEYSKEVAEEILKRSEK